MAKRRTINDSIEDMITSQINSIPQIEVITITKIYEDNHADCQLDTGDILECIPVIASNLKVNNKGLLIPIKDDEFYIISR